MECNRDEALKVKELAERKFTEKDYVAAKKFALKAQTLYPSLEGIGQMLTLLDVYIASEAKVNGERDWYAVLHINSSADEDAVKKQYRRLALLLHPDKNKFAGAEGAFQLVSEACNVLSDKSKKILYDQKIFVKGFHQRKFRTRQNNNTQAPINTGNGSYQNAKSRTEQNNSYRPPYAPPPPSEPSPLTFWTSCAGCCMQHKYHKMYLNKRLLCAKCKQPFLATELPVPHSRHNLAQRSSQLRYNKNDFENSFAPPGAPAPPGAGASRFQHGLSRSPYKIVVKLRTQQNNSYRRPYAPPPPSRPPPQTFWTSCAGCSMRHEYHRMYLNKSLLCPKCKQSFLATELPLPPSRNN